MTQPLAVYIEFLISGENKFPLFYKLLWSGFFYLTQMGIPEISVSGISFQQNCKEDSVQYRWLFPLSHSVSLCSCHFFYLDCPVLQLSQLACTHLFVSVAIMCQAGLIPFGGSVEESAPCLSSSFWWDVTSPWCFLAYMYITLISISVFTWHSPLHVSSSSLIL